MKVKLDDWQKEILDYEGDIGVAKGRRVGCTYIMAIKAIEYLMHHKNHHPTSQIVCVSLTEDQAKLVISFARDYAEEKYPKFIGKKNNKPTQSQITMIVNKNKRILLARPVGNTGDGARGFEGQILMVDEAPRMPKLFWASAKPLLLTTDGKIWMWGTFEGKKGYFWERFNEREEETSRFKFWWKSSEEVLLNRPISESWTQEQREGALRILEEDKREMSQLEYSQEYLAIPLDELRQFFSDELLQKVCILKRHKPPIPERDRFMGVDLARMGGDKIVYSILQRYENNNIQQVENIVKDHQLTGQTEDDILQLETAWNFTKIGIDAGSGSMGIHFMDFFMQIPDIKRKILAMNNRDVSLDKEGKRKQKIFKEDMYDNLLAMMEKGEILLLDDPEIFASLKSVQWEITDRGSVTKIRIFGNYTHTAEALVRAAYLAKKEKINKLWISYI